MGPKRPEKLRPSEEEEEELQPQPLAQRQDLGENIADSLLKDDSTPNSNETQETQDEKMNRLALEFLDLVTQNNPNKRRIKEIFMSFSGKDVFKWIKVVAKFVKRAAIEKVKKYIKENFIEGIKTFQDEYNKRRGITTGAVDILDKMK